MNPPTPPSNDDVTEAELARRCAEGDRGAWELFLDRYGALLRALVRRLLRHYSGRADDVDTDEIVADVLLALVRRERALLKAYKPEYRLSTYLGVIIRTEVIRWLRRRRRTPLPLERASEAPDVSTHTRADRLLREDDKRRALQELREGLQALPDRDRLLLTMRYLDGCDYKTIARVLNISASSVGQLLHRAKTRLATALPHLEARIDTWQ